MIGTVVKVIVDRPLGSAHPKHNDLIYSVNYGYIPGIIAPDGEEQDTYIPSSNFMKQVILTMVWNIPMELMQN